MNSVAKSHCALNIYNYIFYSDYFYPIIFIRINPVSLWNSAAVLEKGNYTVFVLDNQRIPLPSNNRTIDIAISDR